MKRIIVTVDLTVEVPDDIAPEDVCLWMGGAISDIDVSRRYGSKEEDLPDSCVVDYDVVAARNLGD
jgi:hypothetical protein